jgi:hypothetical protein
MNNKRLLVLGFCALLVAAAFIRWMIGSGGEPPVAKGVFYNTGPQRPKGSYGAEANPQTAPASGNAPVAAASGRGAVNP